MIEVYILQAEVGLIDGLDKLINAKTGINVMIAQDAVSCVALGTGKALDNLDALEGKARK